MDPLEWLLTKVLGGGYGPVAGLIVIAIILSRATTKIEGHGAPLVEAVKQLGADLSNAPEEDRAAHTRTRERLDVKAAEIVAAVVADGGSTRADLAGIEDRRWSEIEAALAGSTPPVGMPTVRRPRMPSTGNGAHG